MSEWSGFLYFFLMNNWIISPVNMCVCVCVFSSPLSEWQAERPELLWLFIRLAETTWLTSLPKMEVRYFLFGIFWGDNDGSPLYLDCTRGEKAANDNMMAIKRADSLMYSILLSYPIKHKEVPCATGVFSQQTFWHALEIVLVLLRMETE